MNHQPILLLLLILPFASSFVMNTPLRNYYLRRYYRPVPLTYYPTFYQQPTYFHPIPQPNIVPSAVRNVGAVSAAKSHPRVHSQLKNVLTQAKVNAQSIQQHHAMTQPSKHHVSAQTKSVHHKTHPK